jgi:hypothetical protein
MEQEQQIITGYKKIKALWHNSKRNAKGQVKLGYKRFLVRDGHNTYHYLLYDSFIASYRPSGITLDTDGFYSQLTFNGMREALSLADNSAQLYKDNGRWRFIWC